MIAIAGHTNATAGFLLVRHVNRASRIITNTEYGQTGGAADLVQSAFDQTLKTLFNRFGQHLAIQPSGHALEDL